jgi:hypothetical protein
MKIPALKIGQGYGGPEFYGCCNTGTRPSIFRMHLGGWSVGPEEACRKCMRFGLTYKDHIHYGEGKNRVWFYKTRAAAVKKFTELYGIRVAENEAVKAEIRSHLTKAKQGDIGSAIALGDYYG